MRAAAAQRQARHIKTTLQCRGGMWGVTPAGIWPGSHLKYVIVDLLRMYCMACAEADMATINNCFSTDDMSGCIFRTEQRADKQVMYDVGQSAQLFLFHGLADVARTLICIKANYCFSERRLWFIDFIWNNKTLSRFTMCLVFGHSHLIDAKLTCCEP